MGHRVTTLNVNTIEPAGNTLTIGASGDSVVLADDVKANTYKDAGGNTLFVSNGSGVLSSVNSGFGDALKLLSTQTVTNQASISFTSGIDSTYKEYIFKFININPATNAQNFGFQVNASGQSGYNETITSTAFLSLHNESGTGTSLGYAGGVDQAEGTAFQPIMYQVGNDADKSGSGELHIFDPSSTTYVKNWYSTCNNVNGDADPYQANSFMGGYVNITAAITEVQFKCPAGNFDGKIKMYGVS